MKRRQFLSCAAAAGGAAILPAALPAKAFTIEPMGAKTEALYAARCQVDPVHASMVNEARERLAGHSDAAQALEAIAKDLQQALICPYCRCRLAMDGSEQPAKPPL